MDTYQIIRNFFDKPSQTVKRWLTLEQAQAWCRRDDTHGEDWFDGYTRER